MNGTTVVEKFFGPKVARAFGFEASRDLAENYLVAQRAAVEVLALEVEASAERLAESRHRMETAQQARARASVTAVISSLSPLFDICGGR